MIDLIINSASAATYILVAGWSAGLAVDAMNEARCLVGYAIATAWAFCFFIHDGFWGKPIHIVSQLNIPP